ncbi:hypothetical protein [Acidaminococcus massiliensis]|uniref:hypothetical protein n=1 Tax=Acidaminococcus massiliensis TaxID=1852375 RepID=UPI00266C8BE0|nr:hypothetical protein [Acidaminococcus massiliensis]
MSIEKKKNISAISDKEEKPEIVVNIETTIEPAEKAVSYVTTIINKMKEEYSTDHTLLFKVDFYD